MLNFLSANLDDADQHNAVLELSTSMAGQSATMAHHFWSSIKLDLLC